MVATTTPGTPETVVYMVIGGQKMLFKIGQKVEIDPEWQKKHPEKTAYGIDNWRDYIGKKYTIISHQPRIAVVTYCLKEDQTTYYWPDYMLISRSLSTLLKNKKLLKEN